MNSAGRHPRAPIAYLSFLVLIATASCRITLKPKTYSEEHNCSLSDDLKEEIHSYKTAVQDILDYTLTGPFQGKTYAELAKFIDKFGPRLSGSQVLEDSIDYMINLTQAHDVKDVRTEKVQVPHWVRIKESVTMLLPETRNIAVIGLGYSISTPHEGITANVIVVNSFDELHALPDDSVKGKIVLYVQNYTTYGSTVAYRSKGAVEAAKKGAVASLIKSITPFSMYTPHTGMQSYSDNVTKIPAAAITLEDGDFIKRLIDRGETVKLNILLLSTFDQQESRNTFIQRKGTLNPEKLVIVSGHIDSWDVGTGAMDDGGGMMVSWAVPIILSQLDLQPKRSVQAILWTGEELGLVGALSYANSHKNDLDNINFIMESDEGTFAPTGLSVAGSQKARCIIAEILQLFSSINATKLVEDNYPGSDITRIVSKGVPGAGLLNKNEKYFWFHHSVADTMNVENPRDLDLCTAFWTAVAYVIADISADIPRDN